MILTVLYVKKLEEKIFDPIISKTAEPKEQAGCYPSMKYNNTFKVYLVYF